MDGMFPMESPTGPLQRIARLEEEANQLDDLPSLPSLSGIDFTVEDSPPPRSLSRQQTPSSSKKYSQTTDILPFTSTPAPAAAILRSQSTIFRADNRPSSDGSTRTIKTAVTQQSYPRSSTFSSLPQELSADQISIEKVDYGSGSGTDSAGSAKRAKRSPRIISPRNPVQETLPQPEQDEHDVTSSSADSYFNPAREIDVLDDLASTSFHQALPSPPVAVNDHDYSIPLTGDSPAVTGSARVERMAANVSTRRKLTARRMSTSDVLPPRLAVSSSSSTPSLPSPPSLPSAPQSHFVETKFNKNATLGENASGLPSAFSPLRERNGDSMLSVEIGRHASPRSNNSHSDVMQIQPNEQDHLPATPSVDGSYSKVFVDSFATPREQRSSGEKRKENVLAALRSNTKPRLAKGTPHPKNVSMRSQVPGSAEVFFTATTSDSAIRRPVDSTPKVNQYLSSLNGLLSRQNQSLIKTVSHNHEEMKRLKKDSKKLRMMSLGGSGEDESKSAAEEEGEATRSEELDQQIGGLIKGNSDINLVHQQISEELGLDVDANSSIAHSTVADDQVVELERKVSKLDSVVAGKDQEIVALRQQILEFQGVSVSEEGRSAYVQELQREIFVLKDQVFDALDKVEAKEDENEQIRGEFYISAQKDTAVVAQFSARNEELLAELEVRDRQVAELNALTTDQVREFQETMDALEQELCAGLEEREAGLKTAKEEMERKRQELEEKIATSETIDELNQIVDEFEGEVKQAQVEIAAITLERDDLVKRLELDGSEKLQEANAKIVQLESIIDGKDQEIVEAFAERERLGFELEDAIAKINELESEHSGIYTEFKEKSNTLRQAEEALEESERQILRHEEEMDALRSTLATERMTGAALSTQLAQFRTHATKAKSPLANELFSTSTRDSTVVALEDELEEAQKEIGELKARLVEMEPSEVKDLRIRTLEETKVELETRVQSLKQQVSLVASPNKTLADDSLFFQSVRGLATPRTPGQFMKNMAWSPMNASANSSLTNRLAEIVKLEELVRQLQAQLSTANSEIDSKLDRLEIAGSGTITLARQLAIARERILQLEAELEGERGLFVRVRTRLETVSCTACGEKFDANEVVGLKLNSKLTDKTPSPKGKGRVQFAMAGFESKVDELESENFDLKSKLATAQNGLAGVSSLKEEIERVRRETSELNLDFVKARREKREMQGVEERLEDALSSLESYKEDARHHVCDSNAQDVKEIQARHSQEAKTVLLLVAYHQRCLEKEMTLRRELAFHKSYLVAMVNEDKRAQIATINDAIRGKFTPPAAPIRRHLTLKSVATGLIAAIRMRKLMETTEKDRLFINRLRGKPYFDVRGKAFVKQ